MKRGRDKENESNEAKEANKGNNITQLTKRVRFTERKEGSRNVDRRRTVNEILQSQKPQKPLQYRNEQPLNIESEFATFEQADLVFEGYSAQVIIKRPKKNIPVAQWCQEVDTSQEMSDNAIGPFVFEQVCNGGRRNILVMEKYDEDLLTYLGRFQNTDKQDYEREALKEKPDQRRLRQLKHRVQHRYDQGQQLKNSIDELFNHIVVYHRKNEDARLCIGDLRFQNMVINTSTMEVRQIDFELRYCVPKQDIQGMDLKLLLKFAVCFSYPIGNSLILDSWGLFPRGRIFLTDLQKRSREVRHIIKKFATLDSKWIRNLRAQYVGTDIVYGKIEKFRVAEHKKWSKNPEEQSISRIQDSANRLAHEWANERFTRELLQFFPERKSPISVAQKVE